MIVILEIYFLIFNIYLYVLIIGMYVFDCIDVEGFFYFKNLSKEDDFECVLYFN